jgi:hypothetical protein
MELVPTRAYDVVLDEGFVMLSKEPAVYAPIVTKIVCPYGPAANRMIAFYNGDSLILACSYNEQVYVG